MAGEAKKLLIARWNVATNKVDGTPFGVMLNPAGYSHTLDTSYAKGSAERWGSIKPEVLALEELVFDGTGVLASGPDGMPPVDKQIADLKRVLYQRTGQDKVDHPVLRITWGSMFFLGRIDSMTVKYTLFKPNGIPLRARVALTFTQFNKKSESAVAKKATDEKLAKQLQVKAGATLQDLCFQLFQDAGMAPKVARDNDLTSFRNVPHGQSLTIRGR